MVIVNLLSNCKNKTVKVTITCLWVCLLFPENTGFMCPSNQTEVVELGISAVAVTWSAGSSLGCVPASGDNFSVGTTDVLCVIFLNENVQVCQFFVTVLTGM